MGPETDGVEHVVVGLRDREHDNLDGRQLLANQSGSLDPVHHRHLDVHDDQVRHEQAGLLDGVQTVLGLPHDRHVILAVYQRRDGSTKERLIVNQQDADRYVRWHSSPHCELALDASARGRSR